MNISFIGGGNMASAIINGMIANGICSKSDLCVSDPSPAVIEKYTNMGIRVITDNQAATQQADIVVLAVKPHIYPIILPELANCSKPLYISIAVGKSIAEIKGLLGADKKVVRTMPNTPAFVGEGMTVLAEPESNITAEEFEKIKQIFSSIGKVEILPERLLNAAGSVSGSSPAYIYMLIEAMADAAVRDGISRTQAYTLAAQSVLGSAKMVLENGEHPGALKDMVCSPGGTTIAAVECLEKNSFRGAIMDAMRACTEKANTL